ncbi:MAG TPA: metallophosphoesterase family protein [Planctomycetota bacterium]|nr:metallophosphoesterase family protein [Planctomycetota bacterium]
MKTLIQALPWLLVAAGAGPLAAQTVTRGPYLQQGNDTSVVVRWRTSTSVVGRVRYGSAPGSLSNVKDEASATTEHAVTLRSLTPNTKYYYSVGTAGATLAGGDANHFFVTSPAPGAPKRTRIWVIGDAGTKDSRQRAVYNAYNTFTGSTHTDLWLMLGDNAYLDGTDAEYQAAVFDMYKPLLAKSVLWSTYGNHDGQSADAATQTGVYFDVFTKPTRGECGGLASGTEAYYSFDYGNIHFISLDSYETSRSVGRPMHTWATNDANATSADWLIAFFHHPPYTKGSHDSDTGSPMIGMRENFMPMLEAAGVDLVLSGHSHSYERSFLIDGHYGTSDTFTDAMKKNGGSGRDPNPYTKSAGLQPHEGTVYVVAGSSGHTSGGSLDHPVMFVSLDELGSLVLDIDGNRLDAKFLRENGSVADSFTIVKGGAPPPADSTKPAITVESPTSSSSYTTNSPAIHLAGSASDNVGVTRVDWTNSAGGTGVSAGTTAWTSYIGLAPGPNTITFSAHDAAGNTAQDAITITYAPDSAPGPDPGPTPPPGSDPAPTPDPSGDLDSDVAGSSSSSDRCMSAAAGPGAAGVWIAGVLLLAAFLRRR